VVFVAAALSHDEAGADPAIMEPHRCSEYAGRPIEWREESIGEGVWRGGFSIPRIFFYFWVSKIVF